MTVLRNYVIRVVCAAIVCAVITSVDPKGRSSGIIKLICGLFLAFTFLQPMGQLSLEFDVPFDGIQEDAASFSSLGEECAKQSLAQVIKEEAEAYILDKAASLNIQVKAQITLSDDPIPLPVGSRICGQLSPYARAQLEHILEDELGIAKENQQWIEQES